MTDARDLTRRELLAAGALAGVTVAAGAPASGASAGFEHRLDFAAVGDGDGWPRWRAPGVANLRRAGGLGLLEAGSDVFPDDPRPVAFPPDHRFGDGEVVARIARGGVGPGVVLRRVGPREYYAAILAGADDVLPVPAGTLAIVRRLGDRLDVIARRFAGVTTGELRLALRAEGRAPTRLTARLESPAGVTEVTAADATPSLQAPGDPGVLATARTVFPSEGTGPLPALGNLHLLPYGVQEGQAFLATPAGGVVVDAIRERSTAAFREIVVRSADPPGFTRPAAVAATTGAPVRGGAIVRVATDVPARVRIEVSTDPRFRRSRTLASRHTDRFGSVLAAVRGLPPGRTVYWRPRLRRRKVDVIGPTRSFRVLPAAGSPERVRVAVGSCASQFGPIFDHLTARRPDAFVWQGDLNYPDTHGPLAQTPTGYAGIWRDFLANPRLRTLLERTCFAAQRDDHDYGIQDANGANLVPWGLTPWEALMEARPYYRFAAGLAEFWVLDQRRFKSDPERPDTTAKTLLGEAQRAWLLRTLASSRAAFKVICSPCSVAPLPANNRDGSWAAGFVAERDLVLGHIARRVGGTTVFVTGDTHWTMVYDSGGLIEARPCPLGIPTPNDITLTQPNVAEDAARRPGVLYADDNHGHFALLEVSGTGSTARLELALVRDDGADAYRRVFTERV